MQPRVTQRLVSLVPLLLVAAVRARPEDTAPEATRYDGSQRVNIRGLDVA